jgi:L-serine dehydratase
MFISALELFKIGIGPSSSHTMGPMVAAREFINFIKENHSELKSSKKLTIKCTLKGSLSATGKGHSTDRAITLGLNNYLAKDLVDQDADSLIDNISKCEFIEINGVGHVMFSAQKDINFDTGAPLSEHPNGMIFELVNEQRKVLITETYFSIGGGFISKANEIGQLVAPLKMLSIDCFLYPFDSAQSMLDMSMESGLSIAEMKRCNEVKLISEKALDKGLDLIWNSMRRCLEKGLSAQGILPGGINIPRRAKQLHQKFLKHPHKTDINDWLCAYAMAVNEENADGHMVVTAPTNGAAGVIPAVLFYFTTHMSGTKAQAREFLLTASAIGGLIKHLSSISGAEVGCQGEVGSAAAMAAAGLCAVRGGTPQQIEHAAEIALEHHLGMTCDPVHGLVQVPCIERNAFGAIKAYTAASLALYGNGEHFMPLDKCIAAMKQTGEEMSLKFKETSLGGLAVTITEC